LTKKELLIDLKTRTWCRLAVSEHGVGVKAIRNIPKGVDPFQSCNPIARWIKLYDEEVEELDPLIQELVMDFCPHEDGVYYAPNTSLNAIDISFYLNHSDKPNMDAAKKGEYFVTNREIKAGEFLTVDYNTYDDRVEDYRIKE
jgi:SET domain-containing protein